MLYTCGTRGLSCPDNRCAGCGVVDVARRAARDGDTLRRAARVPTHIHIHVSRLSLTPPESLSVSFIHSFPPQM